MQEPIIESPCASEELGQGSEPVLEVQQDDTVSHEQAQSANGCGDYARTTNQLEPIVIEHLGTEVHYGSENVNGADLPGSEEDCKNCIAESSYPDQLQEEFETKDNLNRVQGSPSVEQPALETMANDEPDVIILPNVMAEATALGILDEPQTSGEPVKLAMNTKGTLDEVPQDPALPENNQPVNPTVEILATTFTEDQLFFYGMSEPKTNGVEHASEVDPALHQQMNNQPAAETNQSSPTCLQGLPTRKAETLENQLNDQLTDVIETLKSRPISVVEKMEIPLTGIARQAANACQEIVGNLKGPLSGFGREVGGAYIEVARVLGKLNPKNRPPSDEPDIWYFILFAVVVSFLTMISQGGVSLIWILGGVSLMSVIMSAILGL